VLGYTITFPGGDLQSYGNFEYRIPIAGPVTAGLFMDVGTVGILRKDALRLDPTGFQNLLSQFPNAQSQIGLQRQLTVAENTNFRVRASTGAELVVQLPIIGAVPHLLRVQLEPAPRANYRATGLYRASGHRSGQE
jgi:outer membrane protein insertion porin family